MNSRTWLFFAAVGVASATLAACATGSGAPRAHADLRRVAQALGDPPPDMALTLAQLPRFREPHHARNCCAFGMDFHVELAHVQVPFFQVDNVLSVRELGSHTYFLPDLAPDPEPNALIYTCRGGFVDTAHAREHADLAAYFALRFAEIFREGGTVEMRAQGALMRVVLAPIPATQIEDDDLVAAAGALGVWTAYQIGTWHEIATWFGYESFSGFSEQVSAFSPEDLYSNALGAKIGAAVLLDGGFANEAQYEVLVAAYLEEALHRLDAVPKQEARAIMHALDGRWWNSERHAPGVMLVTRRKFPSDPRRVIAWRAEDAFAEGEAPSVLTEACGGATERPLFLPTRVGGAPIGDVVSITWTPEGWANRALPFPRSGDRTISDRDLDALTTAARARMEGVLGSGFDGPRSDPRDGSSAAEGR